MVLAVGSVRVPRFRAANGPGKFFCWNSGQTGRFLDAPGAGNRNRETSGTWQSAHEVLYLHWKGSTKKTEKQSHSKADQQRTVEGRGHAWVDKASQTAPVPVRPARRAHRVGLFLLPPHETSLCYHNLVYTEHPKITLEKRKKKEFILFIYSFVKLSIISLF